MATIHPTAIVDEGAQLGAGVSVGPYAIIEPDVVVGEDCTILASAIIRRYTTLGAGNVVHPFAVLGGEPQDYRFDPASPTYLRIGDHNVFREGVTISRATKPGGATTIGSHGYFMTCAHVGHDSVVGDHVVLANSAAIAGHCEIGQGANLSAHAGVHQFCWVGEMAMFRGNAGASQHVPPFCIVRGINELVGLNVIGMRRAGFSSAERLQVKQAYQLLYRQGLTPRAALEEMDGHTEWAAPAAKFREFCRRVVTAQKPYQRGFAADCGRARVEEEE